MVNPLTSVTPIDFYGNVTGSAVTSFPPIGEYVFRIVDVTSDDANYSESMLYNKMLKGKRRTVSIRWNMPTLEDASSLLQAFSSEYILMTILDPEIGAFISKRFYVNEKTIGAFKSAHGRWDNISFLLTQQDADEV